MNKEENEYRELVTRFMIVYQGFLSSLKFRMMKIADKSQWDEELWTECMDFIKEMDNLRLNESCLKAALDRCATSTYNDYLDCLIMDNSDNMDINWLNRFLNSKK